jgi:predicted nucleic-acid-binding protein
LEQGAAQGEISDITILESVWVLQKHGGVAREIIASDLGRILRLRGIRHPGKRVALDALTLYASTNCDIADCLLAARARSRRIAVCSFDADFKKLGCAWEEPA